MPQPTYLVKLNVGGVDTYVFCSERKNFPVNKLKQAGSQDLVTLYNGSPQAVGVAILPVFPPPGPTGAVENTLDWDTYASRIQVGP
jgi:hypothetical protein